MNRLGEVIPVKAEKIWIGLRPMKMETREDLP